MEYLLLILGIVVLLLGGECLVRSAVGLNMKFKLSPLLIGTTVVSFGTSAPELIVSINAVLDGNSQIAVGNVIGSNVANIGLVLGITVLFRTVLISRSKYLWSWSLMLFASLIFLTFSLDFEISQIEGILLIIGLIVFIFLSIRREYKSDKHDYIEGVNHKKISSLSIFVYFILGGLGLWYGSELLVDNAIVIAQNIGVSDFIIAISVVALGTSLPELVTSIIAMSKGENSISIGNLIGSNIFNIFAVLGVSSMLNPLMIDGFLIQIDIPIMIGFAVMVGLFMFLGKRMGPIEGIALLSAYIAYIAFGFL
ncbi:MAG: calcium/sodium antiporter [Bacteroidota bacterium]|nr:calcium/sodium antiporter [Bacteroidota bacterium]